MLKKIIEIIFLFIEDTKNAKHLFGKPLSIASYKLLCNLYKYDSSIKTIMDVGANQGQFCTTAKRFFSDATIHSFEPVPKCFDILKNHTTNLEGVYLYNMALGNQEGHISFYQNEHSHASSALQVSEYQKKEIPLTAAATKIDVKISKLDDFIGKIALNSPTLLKLDVQGYEKEVLKGGETFIQQVDYILLETSFVEMYQQEPLFNEMNDYIQSQGFILVEPLDTLVVKGRILQMDVLYKRKEKKA